MSKGQEDIVKLGVAASISAIDPDWSREQVRRWWDPSRQLIKSIREYQKWQKSNLFLSSIFKAVHVLEHRFWSVVTGADIPLNCQIDGGLVLPHPNGIVIHPSARIGPNCMIFQQVTIVGSVRIGGHVDIGAGARLLKQVKVGNHAKIGANAVVICDVPECATAVGVPARIIHHKQDSEGYISENDCNTETIEKDLD